MFDATRPTDDAAAEEAEAATIDAARVALPPEADDLPALFGGTIENEDYAANRAARLYPVELRDGVDLNGSARAAYARGYADALRDLTP